MFQKIWLRRSFIVCDIGPRWHHTSSRMISYMHPANGRRRYIETSSIIGWAHTQNDPCFMSKWQRSIIDLHIQVGLAAEWEKPRIMIFTQTVCFYEIWYTLSLLNLSCHVHIYCRYGFFQNHTHFILIFTKKMINAYPLLSHCGGKYNIASHIIENDISLFPHIC